jgi:VWFA-related protein
MRLLFALFLIAAVAPAQDPTTPTFSTGTRLVLRAVKVRDSGGRSLAGLRASDFTVTENGVPQSVAICEYQQIADGTEGSRSSAGTDAGLTPVPRKMVLYFDLGGIARSSMGRAFASARSFLERGISSADSIAIMASLRGNLLNVQDFTSDRDLLLSALGKLMKSDQESNDEESTIGFSSNKSEFNVFATNRRLATLGRATRQLERTRERKALIYFSDGWGMGQGRNLADMRALVSSARRANVEFYPIDTRGLAVQPGMGDASIASPGGVEAYNGVANAALNETFELSQDALYSLAAETGERHGSITTTSKLGSSKLRHFTVATT